MPASAPWAAALFALFLWWFSTGAIMWAVRRAERGGRPAHLALALFTAPVFLAGLWGFGATAQAQGVGAVYGAFISALAVWGWVELAFLTGVITGPNRAQCAPGARGFERFMRAYGTIAYHETLLAVVLFWLLSVTLGAPNTVGLWTFALLFFARVSAKLNLFLGVPRIHVEFLPSPLAHLASHFRIARLNWAFPFSITALSFATAYWVGHLLMAPAAGPEAVGLALLATLAALALLEHWLMVLPLPDQKLWRWMLPERKKASPAEPAPHPRP